MKTLTLNIPGCLDLDNQEVAMLFATRLYEHDKLYPGQAAELAGLLGKYNVSLFNYPASDVARDVQNA